MARSFLEAAGGDEAAAKERHGAFKIIPRVTEGSWMVKQAVGQNTPVLLGRKLTTKYFRCACVHACLHALGPLLQTAPCAAPILHAQSARPAVAGR